jgi:predicted membrane protein
MAIFKEHSYFHHPKDLNYGVFLFFWSIGLSLLGVVVKIRSGDLAAVFSYAAALTLVGLFIMFANCVVNVFQPRYALPMWELTIVSLFVLFGAGIGPLFQHCEQALSTGSRARKIAFRFGK